MESKEDIKHKDRIKAIIDFWFKDIDRNSNPPNEMITFWFKGGPEVDE